MQKILLVAALAAASFSFGQAIIHDPQGEVCRLLLERRKPLPAYPDTLEAFIETERLFILKETGTPVVRVFRKTDWRRLDDDVQFHVLGGGIVQIPIVLDPLARGIGYGFEAKSALIRWAFEVVGATRIRDKISHHNAESLRMHTKLGYRFHVASQDGGFYDLLPENFMSSIRLPE